MRKLLPVAVLALLLGCTVRAQAPSDPQIQPSAGPFTGSVTVTITEATPGYVIYYTVDGSTPTAASTKYVAPFVVSATATVKYVAILAPSTNVLSALYTINSPPPVCIPPAVLSGNVCTCPPPNTLVNGVCTVPITPTCLNSSTTWSGWKSIASQTGSFRISFDSTPNNINMDGVVGISKNPAIAYSSLAAIVRFNSSGTIDAMNGANSYRADAIVPYSAGTSYHFDLDINIATRLYTITVNGTVIGTNFAFRPEQSTATLLNQINAFTEVGTLKVCNIVISGVVIPPPPPPPTVHSTTLNWNASAGATGYNVYRSTTTGGPYTKIASITLTTYKDTSVTNGAKYFYTVTATNSGGESAKSSEVSVTIPLARKKPAKKGKKIHGN